MVWPMDIASVLAKKIAKRDALLGKVEKLNKEIAELESKK